MSARISIRFVDFVEFCLSSIAFVAFWQGCFWCETGAGAIGSLIALAMWGRGKDLKSARAIEITQSGIIGSSPQIADPTLLAVADPTRFTAENGELMVALRYVLSLWASAGDGQERTAPNLAYSLGPDRFP